MRRLIGALGLGLSGCAVLIALGVWQVQRLSWKEGILADISARIEAPAVALPETPDPQADRYLPVQASGQFSGQEIPVLVSRKGQGAGYRLVAAFQTNSGRSILVDRGFIPVADYADHTPAQGAAQVVGNLHWPAEVDSYTPAPDVARGIWFARDLPALSRALATQPLLIVARTITPQDPRVQAMPVDGAGIPNDHLQYAVTWFGLALVWAGMTLLLLWRIWRRSA